MVEREIKVGKVYRHFKGKDYKVLHLAIDRESGEDVVVYEALYKDHQIYVRSLEKFASEVDHEKYPDMKQKYRFEETDF